VQKIYIFFFWEKKKKGKKKRGKKKKGNLRVTHLSISETRRRVGDRRIAAVR
jgi:hypothetical protein